jgi:molybdopterin molybdotransferase
MVDEATVRLHKIDPPRGHNVLPRGTSLRAGDAVLHQGAVLRPIEIAILAEVGHSIVTVTPRPRVAILPTGNELVAVGERPDYGQIRNSNGPMLQAAAARAGADALELGIARDSRGDMCRWIEQGLAADVLVLSGGVSAGKFDLVPEVLASFGVERVLHKIALRPGKPLWFGIKRETQRRLLVFGLPGNPVSSLVCFELFVRPAIAALAGRGFTSLPSVRATLSHVFEHAGGRAACLPALVKTASGNAELSQVSSATCGNLSVEILRWQGSADLATVAHANGLARLSATAQRLEPGAVLDVLLI